MPIRRRNRSMPNLSSSLNVDGFDLRHTRHRSKAVNWCHMCSSAIPKEDVATLPTVFAYISEWGTSPFELTHICSVAPDPLLCKGPKNESQFEPPDQFWIPDGMPYVAAISLIWGPIYMTPFYSVIPSLAPRVPRGIFCLSKLTLNTVLDNPVFRHELFFNPQLQLEPPIATTQAATTGRVWSHLEYELGQIVPPSRDSAKTLSSASVLVRAPIPTLPEMLEGVGLLMLNILPASLELPIKYLFHRERLLGQSGFLDDLLQFLVAVLDKYCIPERKKWVRAMEANFAHAAEEFPRKLPAQYLVQGLRTAVALLNMTKLDQINALVRERVPNLVASTVTIERQHFRTLVSQGYLSPAKVRAWLLAQPKIENSKFFDIIKLAPTKNPLMSHLISGFVLSLSALASPAATLPGVFVLDTARILHLQSRLQQYVVPRIEREVVSVYQNTHANCLADWLAHNLQPQSSVYQLIETRILHQIMLAIYESVSSIPTGKRPHRSLPPELDSIVDDIKILLQLHWASAGPIYEEADLELHDTAVFQPTFQQQKPSRIHLEKSPETETDSKEHGEAMELD